MVCRACFTCLPHHWHPVHARPRVIPDRPPPAAKPKPFLPGTRIELWRNRRARRPDLPEVPRLRRSIIMPPEPPAEAMPVLVGEVLVSWTYGRMDPAILEDLARRTLPAHADRLAAYYKRHPERWEAFSRRHGAMVGAREEARKAAAATEVAEWRERERKRKAAEEPFDVLDALPYLSAPKKIK